MAIKLFHPPKLKKEVKKRLTVRVPVKMLNDITICLTREKMSQRKRSEWIAHSIISLGEIENFADLIAEDWVEPGQSCPVQITLDKDAQKILETLKDEIINKRIHINEPQSSIVRTAINQKLLCELND